MVAYRLPAMELSRPAWVAWRYRIRGLLYWGGMSYWTAVDDPWTDPATYGDLKALRQGKKGAAVFNGEGTLVYPGRDAGLDGIVPSLRLKALRDAIEDYEYLALLERAGRGDAAQAVVESLASSWYAWDKNPEAYQQARARLASMILTAFPSP